MFHSSWQFGVDSLRLELTTLFGLLMQRELHVTLLRMRPVRLMSKLMTLFVDLFLHFQQSLVFSELLLLLFELLVLFQLLLLLHQEFRLQRREVASDFHLDFLLCHIFELLVLLVQWQSL